MVANFEILSEKQKKKKKITPEYKIVPIFQGSDQKSYRQKDGRWFREKKNKNRILKQRLKSPFS